MESRYRTFNSFLKDHFGARVWKISLDAGLTCPHRDTGGQGGCIFCNARGSGTGAAGRGIALSQQIETQLEALGRYKKARAFIAYFQSFTNTHAPVDELQRIFDAILPYPEIVGLAIGTRPDCVDEERLALIDSYADKRLVWIEYGLQSAHDATLRRINRGHTAADFRRAVQMSAAYRLRICAHVILGLPGEDLRDNLATAHFLNSLPITDAKPHLLYVARDTALETLYRQGGYTPLTLDAYAGAAALFLAHLREDIVIQRITGDPHADELIAPGWALEKTRVRTAIHAYMDEHGLRQGSRLPPA